ncbi:MAG: hypothetical protein KGL41_03450 [Actinomycetales bacterium]|nr:hypothetical protein [Actinomycetales bacterium]
MKDLDRWAWPQRATNWCVLALTGAALIGYAFWCLLAVLIQQRPENLSNAIVALIPGALISLIPGALIVLCAFKTRKLLVEFPSLRVMDLQALVRFINLSSLTLLAGFGILISTWGRTFDIHTPQSRAAVVWFAIWFAVGHILLTPLERGERHVNRVFGFFAVLVALAIFAGGGVIGFFVAAAYLAAALIWTSRMDG